ncbi:MAG: PIG-L family deacetylase, partial [Candidatus Eremiobacterota bacterium]
MRRMALSLLLAMLLAAGPSGPEPVDVLFVGAHPDDDSGATASLAALIRDRGIRVGVITATRGEGGGNAVGRESGAALGLLREREQRLALESLRIQPIFYLDLVDWGYTTSAAATRERWGHQRPLERLVRLVRLLQPEVVITMNPSPSGHGHHQYAARLATEAYFLAGEPEVFPEQLEAEHLLPHRPRKLYYALAYGAEGLDYDLAVQPDPDAAEREVRALRMYASQGWADLPRIGPDFVLGTETFKRGHCRVPGLPSAGLLDGLDSGLELSLSAPWTVPAGQSVPIELRLEASRSLPAGRIRLSAPAGWDPPEEVPFPPLGAGSRTWRWKLAGGASGVLTAAVEAGAERYVAVRRVEVSPSVQAEVEPIPPVVEFEAWTARFGLEELRRLVGAEVACPAGFPARIPLRVHNRGAARRQVEVRVGALGQQRVVCVTAEAGSVQPASASVVVPPEQPAGAQPIELDGRPAGTLQVVPFLEITRGTWQVDGDLSEATGQTSAPVSSVWEGRVDGSDDLSGRFWAAWDEQRLYFAVDVADQCVLHQIAPDDVSGHWRTDAIEVCIDPGASEHTLTTLKLGVIPFDTQGHPQACRDADARPGPVPRRGCEGGGPSPPLQWRGCEGGGPSPPLQWRGCEGGGPSPP